MKKKDEDERRMKKMQILSNKREKNIFRQKKENKIDQKKKNVNY